MNNSKIKVLLVGLILIVQFQTIKAEDGIFAGAFMRMGLGARANAMGNAYTGVAGGSVAAYSFSSNTASDAIVSFPITGSKI
jgi:hypothetical protein